MHEDLHHHLRRGGGVEAPQPIPGPALLHFGDPAAEYAAARESVAIFDLSDRTTLELTGGEPARFLHSYCTNDLLVLPDGGGCEAFVTNVKGRIVGHVRVAIDGATVRIDADPAAGEALSAHLGKYALLAGVEIADRTAEFAKLFVTGPNAAGLLGLEDLPLDGFRRIEAAGTSVGVQRTDPLGGPGFLLVIAADAAIGTWNALTFDNAVPGGWLAYEPLRIEAALPRYGVDLTDEHLAQEAARTERAISFTKGCYLGQEPIHRLHVMGHTNRELRVLRIDGGDEPPEPGVAVLEGERELGRLTSIAAVPGTDHLVGLGVLRHPEDPSALTVDGRPAKLPE